MPKGLAREKRESTFYIKILEESKEVGILGRRIKLEEWGMSAYSLYMAHEITCMV